MLRSSQGQSWLGGSSWPTLSASNPILSLICLFRNSKYLVNYSENYKYCKVLPIKIMVELKTFEYIKFIMYICNGNTNRHNMFIKRNIESLITNHLKGFSSIAISGARQTGKSTLLKNCFGEKYYYFSFDDLLLRERAKQDPALFMSEIKTKTIFDEIQYFPELLSYIKMRIDEYPERKGSFILTGSQQFSMMKNLSESLAGRIALLRLFPLSYTELSQTHLSKTITKTTNSFFKYACLNGLYPELCTNTLIDTKTWYSSYVQTFLEKDIKAIYNIGDLHSFGRFLRILAARCSQLLNYSDISKEVGVSVNTIKNWVSILEVGNIIYLLQPYYSNIEKRIIKSPKVYWLDNGLVAYLTGIYNEDQLKFGIMSGALFENLVITETLKFLNNLGLHNQMYFLRTSNKQEVDLLIQNQRGLLPCEIKLSQSPKPLMAKSMENMRSLFPKLNLQDGLLVCMVNKGFKLTKNTNALNLHEYFDFLKQYL